MKPTTITTGTRVAFSRAFLKSIHAFTGWHPFARGEVLNIQDLGGIKLATIAWDCGTGSCVNLKNLVRQDRIHLEPV
jgi:hypothetical protein